MKTTLKNRIWALVLVFAMLAPMFPVMHTHVHAAGTLNLSVSDLGASWTDASNSSGKASWTADGKNIIGTATGYKSLGIFSSTVNTKLTLTNNKSGEAILSFNYTLTGGGKVAASVGTMANNTYSGTLAAGASVTITLTSPSGTSTNTLKITDLSLVLNATGDVNTTFHAPVTGGSYKVDGTAINSDTVKTAPIGTAYSLTATAASGYKFVGWYQEIGSSGKYFSTAATTTVEVDSDSTIYPVFVSTATAVFQVGTGNYFYDLDDAVNYATTNSQNQVTLISSGTISDANYTIPAGMTLYIPYSTDYTPKGAKPVSISENSFTPTNYVTLTLGANTTITVNGTLEVGANYRYISGGNTYGGCPKNYGAISMSAGSSIVVNSDATLYAWGYIHGNGSVTANSGAKVYEFMQIADFYGGSNLGDMAHMFPFSQYYVQNIEVPLTINYGAAEYLYVKLVISSYELPAEVPFIGTGAVTPMFKMEEGSTVTKDYDPTTDRLILDINGNAALQSVAMEPDLSGFSADQKFAIQLALSSMLGGTTINSANYILCLNSNMTINVNSGTTTVSQEISALPGVEIYVDYGATLKLASGDSSKTTVSGGSGGKNAYLFDSEQWGNYIFANGGGKQLITAIYSPTANRYKRTAADLKDVVLDVNGTIITDGFLYTTVNYEYEFDDEGNLVSLTIVGGGASIISSEGTGVIAMNNGAGQEMGVYNLDGAGASETTIFAASAQLKNGDGTYLDTTGAAAGTNFNYCSVHDCWYKGLKGECEKCNVPSIYEITWIINGEQITVEVEEGTVPSYNGTPIKTPDASGHYIFAGWATTENGTVLTTLPAVTGNATYYAVFTSAAHNDDKIEGGKHYCTVCNYTIGSCADTDKNHKCDVGGEDYACHQGTLTTQNGQAATCGVDGWKAYYQCSCGKLYANADATTEITDLASWKIGDGKIPATGNHIPNEDDGDCTTDVTCSVCGTVTTEGNASHDSSYVNNGDGTHDYVCSICQTVEKDNEKHTYENGSCVCGAEERLKGDVDLDGDVDFEDAVLLTRYTMDVEDIENETALANGDVNGDGIVDFEDAVKLTRYTMGLETLD